VDFLPLDNLQHIVVRTEHRITRQIVIVSDYRTSEPLTLCKHTNLAHAIQVSPSSSRASA
jgi:hypothetical protein